VITGAGRRKKKKRKATPLSFPLDCIHSNELTWPLRLLFVFGSRPVRARVVKPAILRLFVVFLTPSWQLQGLHSQ
jgi:hypothetical protein